MRTIKRSSQFKADFRQIKADPRHTADIDNLLAMVLALLVADRSLPESCRDHDLVGEWRGYRECHIKPDLLLIYGKHDADVLRLVRLGSHSNLFKK